MDQEVTAVPVDELIAADHRLVSELLDAATSTVELDDRRRLVEQVVALLSQHAAAEEQVVYPVLRKEQGDAVADHALEEHQAMKDVLAHLDKAPGDDPAALARLAGLVEAHVREEEDEVLPSLRAAVGAEKMADMGRAFARAEGIAPTHPHPHAPNRPPGNVVAGTVAGVVDRVRDAVTGRDRP